MDFWEIHDRYYVPLKRYVAAMTRDEWAAEDIVQETFLKVQTKLDSLRDKSKIKSWMYSIARNQSLDHLRKVSALKEGRSRSVDQVGGVEPALAQVQLERQEMSRCVRDKIDLLPDSKREVIILFDIMGLNHREVAEILGLENGAVRVRLHRARKAMKEILDADCVFEHDERDVFVCVPKEKTIETL